MEGKDGSLTEHDVIVIGGGPGGAAAATLVAKWGHEVLLLERSAEPKFKIGDMPSVEWALRKPNF